MPKFTKEIATLWYRSPELMLGDDNYGTGVDIWNRYGLDLIDNDLIRD